MDALRLGPALAGLSCSLVLLLTAAPSSRLSRKPTDFHAQVEMADWSDEEASLYEPAALAVRAVLLPEYELLDQPWQAIERTERVLRTAFRSLVISESSGVRYKAIWCEEIHDFKIVCCESAAFLVLHAAGTVRVLVEETTLL